MTETLTRLGKTDVAGIEHGGVYVDSDGRVREMTVHQSMLDTWLKCPERLRAELLRPPPDNDAAGMGTSCHHAVAQQMNLVVQTGTGYRPAELQELALTHWREVMRPRVHLSLNLEDREYERQVTMGIANWWQGCWVAGMELWVEASDRSMWTGLELPMRWPDFMTVDGIRVHLGGSCDVAQPHRLIDWKFSERPRKEWEAQRWDIQATTYMALARYHEWCPDPPVMVIAIVPRTKAASPSFCRVERGPEWDDWLRWQVLSLVRMVSRFGMADPWPTNDQHTLCSQRWCSNWSRCKGAFGIEFPLTQAQIKELAKSQEETP